MFLNSFVVVLLQSSHGRDKNIFGDTLGGLLRQIPTGLILQICITGMLLIAAMVYFTYRRRRRAEKAKHQSNAPAPAYYDYPAAYDIPAGDVYGDMDDMPDLDMLVDDSTLEKELPDVPDFLGAPPAPPAAPPVRVIPPGAFSVRLHTGMTAEAREVLSILRDTGDDRLIIQMNDTAYRTLLDSPDAKKEFTKIMRELADVVMQPDDRVPESTPESPVPEPEPPAPEPEPPTLESEVPNLRDLIEESPPVVSFAPPPPIGADGEMPGDLPSFRLEDHPVEVKKGGLLRPKKYESAPVPELDIPSAIEAYLQHKLRHTPEYAGREIHVRPAPDGGVRIQVDQTFFEAVNDVADPQIRAFIQAAIQEWQDRQ